MRENWPRALAFNLMWEGGAAIRPNEPGGAVNKGVSLQAYREWCSKHGKPYPTVDDLLKISDGDVESFYRERADRIGFDTLPSGYDLALFNASTMQGINGALDLHNRAKGDLGYLIILHMQKKMNDKNCGPHINPMNGKTEWYGPGWSSRLVATYEAARELQDAHAVHADVVTGSS